jgi:phosphatidylserine/phosphatidylglycerophosphate/cardiolipin synthase-like enzyme
MWGSTGAQPNLASSRFGADKLNNTPHNFIVAGNEVELYFSPSDGTTSQIINTIMDADASVNFATLVFTRNDIADAVVDRSNDFFVDVTGLIEMVNASSSEYQYLLDNFVNVRSYADVQGQLHHKYVIIDADSPDDDPVVLTGSHNWSSSAENSNDENTLIIHNDEIANQFYQEYSQRYNDVTVGIEEFFNNTNISAYSNPVVDQLYITDINFDQSVTFTVTDASGKVIMSEVINTVSGADIKLNLSSLDKGIYLVSLILKNESKTIKIIKK